MKKSAHACTWACRCGTKYSVMSTDLDLHLVPDRFKCWGPLKCRYYFKRDDRLIPGPIVRAVTLFQMLNDMGSDEERQCSPADLKKVMVGRKVTAISVEPATRLRSLITNITFEGGATVHLATSTKGVTVYKVTHE